jgi:hypothetical protein
LLVRRKPEQRSRRRLPTLFALLTNQPSGEIVHACCRQVGQRTQSSRGVWQREHWIFADNGVRTIIVETANRFARDLIRLARLVRFVPWTGVPGVTLIWKVSRPAPACVVRYPALAWVLRSGCE